jgi:hypothetical protein
MWILKNSKLNQKLEHVDDISFRELFGRIKVGFFFHKIRYVPYQNKVFVSTLAILFCETNLDQLP